MPERFSRNGAGHRLHLTGAGEAARVKLRELVTELRGVVHEGISDEEYAAALKVLRRMVANVEAAKPPGLVLPPGGPADPSAETRGDTF